MECKYPLVSVIMPTYNGELFIYKALNSVINQTYNKFEIIVVDDGSTDNTRNIVDEFIKENKCNIIFIELGNNYGRSRARNEGLSHVSGDFIAFLDVDDVWSPKKIEKQLILFNTDNKIGAVGVSALCKDLHNINNKDHVIKPWARGDNTFSSMLTGNAIGVTPGVVIRRSALNSDDKFDENLETMEDYDFWLNIAKRMRFDFIDEPLVTVYRHERNSFYDYKKSVEGVIKFGLKNMNSLNGKDRCIFKKNVVKGILDFHAIRYAKSSKLYYSIKCVWHASKISILYTLLLGPYSLSKCFYYYMNSLVR